MRWFAILLLLTVGALAQSSKQPSRSQLPSPQVAQQPASDQRGTEQSPLVVKTLRAPKSEAEAKQEEHDRHEKTEADREKAELDKRLAFDTQRIADETTRLAHYTWWLAAITFLVAGVTGFLGYATWVAAKAARAAAEHIPTVERAYLFMRVVEHNTNIVLSKYEFFDEEHPDEPAEYRPVIDFVFDNVGKTAAIIREVSATIEHWTNLPTSPTYSPKLELLPRVSYVKPGFDSEKKITFLVRDLTMGQIASLMQGNSALWFFGNVVYDDIFGVSHEHRFVWRYISGYFLPYYGNLEYTKNA